MRLFNFSKGSNFGKVFFWLVYKKIVQRLGKDLSALPISSDFVNKPNHSTSMKDFKNSTVLDSFRLIFFMN